MKTFRKLALQVLLQILMVQVFLPWIDTEEEVRGPAVIWPLQGPPPHSCTHLCVSHIIRNHYFAKSCQETLDMELRQYDYFPQDVCLL
jgi:hypothetical protein